MVRMITKEIREIVSVIVEAGKAIMDVYESPEFGVSHKEDRSPLTRADQEAHRVIQEGLEKVLIGKKALPMLSEEGRNVLYKERRGWDRYWLVDPLDGTKEFIKKNGEFTVNIALIREKRVEAGFVYAPVKKTLYWGWVGMGAYKVDDIILDTWEDRLNKGQSLVVSQGDLKRVNIVASRSHLSPETERYIEEVRKLYPQGSLVSAGSSLKLCMVAEGTADVYPRFAPTMEWDTAAAQGVCQEAGVRVVDIETGQIMAYNRRNLKNSWFLVSNNRKFEEFL